MAAVDTFYSCSHYVCLDTLSIPYLHITRGSMIGITVILIKASFSYHLSHRRIRNKSDPVVSVVGFCVLERMPYSC